MRASVAGDRAQYARLLEALVPLVRAIARSCLVRNGGDESELDDIVQECFLAIHLKRHLWDQSRPLVPWVRALVVNKSIDGLRRKGHRVMVTIDAFENVLAAPVREEELKASEIEALIVRLKGRERDVLESVALRGLTVRDAAARLGISEGSARVTLHRGLKKLAELYRKSST